MNWFPQGLLTRIVRARLKARRVFPWRLFNTGESPPASVNTNVVKLFVIRPRRWLLRVRKIHAFPWILFHTGETPPVSVNLNVVGMVTRKRGSSWPKAGRFAKLVTPIFHSGQTGVSFNETVIRFITRRRVTHVRGRRSVFRYQAWLFAGTPAPGPPSEIIWVSPLVRSSFRRGNA